MTWSVIQAVIQLLSRFQTRWTEKVFTSIGCCTGVLELILFWGRSAAACFCWNISGPELLQVWQAWVPYFGIQLTLRERDNHSLVGGRIGQQWAAANAGVHMNLAVRVVLARFLSPIVTHGCSQTRKKTQAQLKAARCLWWLSQYEAQVQ